MKNKRINRPFRRRSDIAAGLFLLLFLLLLQACSDDTGPDDPANLSIELTGQDVSVFRGDDGSAKAVVKGGIPPYSYEWSNGETDPEIDGLAAGLYSVTVSDDVDSVATGSIRIQQPVPENSVTDREGNIYLTVRIGDQVWMQENLRVTVDPDSNSIVSYLYNNDEANEETFGRLYTWNVAMNGSGQEGAQGICPAGWHIPSDGEWKTLEIFLGMTQQEADMTNTWRGSPVGTILAKGGGSGYEALFAGRMTSYGTFSLLNQYEYVWTSTEYGDNAWRRCFESGVSTSGRWNTFPKTYGFSVRCLKD
ncbi:MAG: FISUMP domain-containing protein [Bacteroidales bacterium]|jgi:uncharacterized protein (TIGR02145 family)|nr:FISUMP domain-containing protein [Bacteroidales bacterium]